LTVNIHVRARPGALLVRADGHLTEAAAAELLEQVRLELRPQPRDVILDLSAIDSIAAAALPYVFRIQQAASAGSRRLVLAGRSAAVQRLLEKTHVVSALEHAEDAAQAEAASL
jgi:anti-anti-sigma factor